MQEMGVERLSPYHNVQSNYFFWAFLSLQPQCPPVGFKIHPLGWTEGFQVPLWANPTTHDITLCPQSQDLTDHSHSLSRLR
jgi:hypothetical protein